MNIQQPPEGILDPQQPYWPADRVSEVIWLRLKGKLTGRRVEGLSENFTSYVKLGDADADRLIANIKKWGKYPQVNQNDKYGGAYNNEAYQKWLVEEFLEKPFREQVDQKIEDRQAARRIADVLNKKTVKQAAQLTTDVIEDPWGEATAPPKQYAVVPTTKLLPPAKEVTEEQKPEAKKKRGSSLVKSMTKTFARMETHFQKLSELSEVSEGNITEIADAFKIQSAALSKGFLQTTTVVTKVTQAVDLQASTMIRIAKDKKDLDQKRLDTQEALNKETSMEQQRSTAGNVRVKDNNKGPGSGTGGGPAGAFSKVFGSSVIGKFLAGKGLKLTKGLGGKIASKVTSKALEKIIGKEAAEQALKSAGREAAEVGLEKGAAKILGKKIPLVGLGIGALFAAERAARGDYLGAGLEIASGAASTIPGFGTAGSLAIDATLIARDSGAVPFAKGGLTKKSTFSSNRPGVTDLTPDLFKKMYEYELDYELKNKLKFGRLYAEGYKKYFDSSGLINKLGGFLSNFIEFFKNVMSAVRNLLRNNPIARTLRALQGGGYEYQDPDTKIRVSVTSRRGMRLSPTTGKYQMHGGSDLAAPEGTPLRAISDGEIVDSDSLSGGWGNFLVFKDDKEIYHLYGHMQSGYKRGGAVKKGDIIGKVGMTGSTTGPHLHWEAGTGWNGGVITGQFDPLDSYKVEQPFFTKREEPKTRPTPSAPGDTRRTYASQRITQNFGQPVGTRIDFPYENEDHLYNAYKTRTGWDIYRGPTKLDTSNGRNAGALQAFINYAETNLARNAGGTSPELTGTDFSRQEPGSTARAKGGPVIANTPYVVGEKGPEMFVPKQDGFVINNQQTAGLIDMMDRMIFGAPKRTNLQYDSRPTPRDAIEAIGGKYYAPYGPDPSFKPVRGAMMQNQLNKLVAMAPLEEQMTTSVQVIRVNNTNTIPIPMPSDSSDDTVPTGNIFRDLHLASIS